MSRILIKGIRKGSQAFQVSFVTASFTFSLTHSSHFKISTDFLIFILTSFPQETAGINPPLMSPITLWYKNVSSVQSLQLYLLTFWGLFGLVLPPFCSTLLFIIINKESCPWSASPCCNNFETCWRNVWLIRSLMGTIHPTVAKT